MNERIADYAFTPVIKGFQRPQLPIPGVPGRIAYAPDGARGLVMDNGEDWIYANNEFFNVKNFHAKGDGQATKYSVVAGGSKSLKINTTSYAVRFAPTDVNKIVFIPQAGAGGLDYFGEIETYVSPSEVLLKVAPVRTPPNNNETSKIIFFGTDDTAAFNNCIAEARKRHRGGVIYVPRPNNDFYLLNGTLNFYQAVNQRFEGATGGTGTQPDIKDYANIADFAVSDLKGAIVYTGKGERFIDARTAQGFRVQNLRIVYANAEFKGHLIDLSYDGGDPQFNAVLDCELKGRVTIGEGRLTADPDSPVRTPPEKNAANAGSLVYLDGALFSTVERNFMAYGKVGVLGKKRYDGQPGGRGYSNVTLIKANAFGGFQNAAIMNGQEVWLVQNNGFEPGLNQESNAYKDDKPSDTVTFDSNWFGDSSQWFQGDSWIIFRGGKLTATNNRFAAVSHDGGAGVKVVAAITVSPFIDPTQESNPEIAGVVDSVYTAGNYCVEAQSLMEFRGRGTIKHFTAIGDAIQDNNAPYFLQKNGVDATENVGVGRLTLMNINGKPDTLSAQDGRRFEFGTGTTNFPTPLNITGDLKTDFNQLVTLYSKAQLANRIGGTIGWTRAGDDPDLFYHNLILTGSTFPGQTGEVQIWAGGGTPTKKVAVGAGRAQILVPTFIDGDIILTGTRRGIVYTDENGNQRRFEFNSQTVAAQSATPVVVDDDADTISGGSADPNSANANPYDAGTI